MKKQQCASPAAQCELNSKDAATQNTHSRLTFECESGLSWTEYFWAMYFATIEKGHVHLEGCMYMGKIQEYREKLQQVSPDDVIIKYIGKIDGHYFYLVDYTEYQGDIGPPQILEIDSKNPDYVTNHCSIEFYSQLVNRFPRSFRSSRSSK